MPSYVVALYILQDTHVSCYAFVHTGMVHVAQVRICTLFLFEV